VSPRAKKPRTDPAAARPPRLLVAAVADPHVGNHRRHGGPEVDGLNRRGRETVEVLRRARARAAELGAEVFAVAGDLFHDRRPEPAVVRAVMGVLDDVDVTARTLLVPGNHDALDASCAGGNTAMAPLYQVAHVVHRPTWFGGVLAVPFDSTTTMEEHLERVLGEQAGNPAPGILGPRILVTHVGLHYGNDAPPWQRAARDAMAAEDLLDLMAGAGIRVALVGNYHNHEAWQRDPRMPAAIQIGTLCPASHGDGGVVDRGLMALVYSDGTIRHEEVPGPRFITTDRPEKLPTRLQDAHSFYVRWTGDPSEAPRPGLGPGGIVAVDVEGPPAPEPERRAPAEPTSGEEAIVAHVAGMGLPEDQAARVRDLAMDLWRRA
jgi:hypothetical protein